MGRFFKWLESNLTEGLPDWMQQPSVQDQIAQNAAAKMGKQPIEAPGGESPLASAMKKLNAAPGQMPYGTNWMSSEALIKRLGLSREEAEAVWNMADDAERGKTINPAKLKLLANRPAPPRRIR